MGKTSQVRVARRNAEIPLWHVSIDSDFSLRHNAFRRTAWWTATARKLLGVALKENRFVFSGDPGLETAEQDQRAIRFVSRLELVRVGLEVKEPAMDHTGVPTKLLAIETVSDTVAATTRS